MDNVGNCKIGFGLEWIQLKKADLGSPPLKEGKYRERVFTIINAFEV